MKKRIFFCISLLLTGMVLLPACSGESEGGEDVTTNDYIRIDDNVNSITLGATEKQRKISIYSNCSWDITIEGQNWTTLSIDKKNGSGNVELWLSSDENPKATSRSATITFKSPGITKTLNVTQEGGKLSLTVDPTEYEFPADGGEKVFVIKGNTDWEVEHKPDWCQLSTLNGKAGTTELKVTVSENPSTTRQTDYIELKGEITATINVFQQGKNYSLTVSTNAFNMDATGGTYDIVVTCNGSWHISIDNASWCHVDKQRGEVNTTGETVIVTCDPNKTTEKQTAHITVVAGDDAVIETITVTQLPATLPEVSKPSAEIKSSTEMKITSTFSSMYPVTECGFCIGTSPNPLEQRKVEGVSGTSGTISATLSVEDGFTYYVRAYAKSDVGINYSEDITVEMKGNQPGNGDNPSPDL